MILSEKQINKYVSLLLPPGHTPGDQTKSSPPDTLKSMQGMQLSARHLLPDGFMSPERELDLEKVGASSCGFHAGRDREGQGGAQTDKEGHRGTQRGKEGHGGTSRDTKGQVGTHEGQRGTRTVSVVIVLSHF